MSAGMCVYCMYLCALGSLSFSLARALCLSVSSSLALYLFFSFSLSPSLPPSLSRSLSLSFSTSLSHARVSLSAPLCLSLCHSLRLSTTAPRKRCTGIHLPRVSRCTLMNVTHSHIRTQAVEAREAAAQGAQALEALRAQRVVNVELEAQLWLAQEAKASAESEIAVPLFLHLFIQTRTLAQQAYTSAENSAEN